MRGYIVRKTIYEEDRMVGEKRRRITKAVKVDKNENFPDGIEFAIQYLYYDNEWKQIARIDNQLHEGKPGTHIHTLNNKEVKRVEMNFNQAKEEIIKIGERIIKWLE
jgi:hypothetical protein